MNAKPARKLPWFLLFLLIVAVGIALPPVNRFVLSADLQLARWANAWVGKSLMLDNLVISLNTKAGDRTVAACFLLLFALHSFWRPMRQEVVRRLAFWAWVAILFTFGYLVQEAAEELFSRDSPGKVLAGWSNLERIYDRSLKVGSTNCFPSGHATAYWFFAFMAVVPYRRMGALLLLAALVAPSTRIMIGSHWATDIFLGSLLLSALLALLAYETRLLAIRTLIERVLLGALDVLRMCRHVPLSERLQAAWTAFRFPSVVAADDLPSDQGTGGAKIEVVGKACAAELADEA